jgi:glucose-1-phosphate thymidylyltransferase
VSIVGVIPAAGYATRLQPLVGSKELLPVGGRPVLDHLVERMRAGGATRLRVVTRPEKEDVIAHAESIGAEVVLGYPANVSASFLAGMDGLTGEDVALIGFPDSIWEPVDGYRRLVDAVRAGGEVALGLFRLSLEEAVRSDVVVRDHVGLIERIDVKPATPASDWVWGCAAARIDTWAGMRAFEWPGSYVDALCREGRDVRGVELSEAWLDIGTPEALARAALHPTREG